MLEMVSNTFRDLFKLIMQKPTSPIKMQTVADIALTRFYCNAAVGSIKPQVM